MAIKLDNLDASVARIDRTIRETLAQASIKISDQQKEIDRLKALLAQGDNGQDQAHVDSLTRALEQVANGVVEFGKGL